MTSYSVIDSKFSTITFSN